MQQLNELARQTDGALARLTTVQISNSAPDPTVQSMLIDLPVRHEDRAAVLRLRIEHDGSRRRDGDGADSWTVEAAIDLGAIGALHAKVTLVGKRIGVQLRAESPAIVAALSQRVDELEAMLAESGLRSGSRRVPARHARGRRGSAAGTIAGRTRMNERNRHRSPSRSTTAAPARRASSPKAAAWSRSASWRRRASTTCRCSRIRRSPPRCRASISGGRFRASCMSPSRTCSPLPGPSRVRDKAVSYAESGCRSGFSPTLGSVRLEPDLQDPTTQSRSAAIRVCGRLTARIGCARTQAPIRASSPRAAGSAAPLRVA